MPFIIATHSERGLRVAARHADGWNCLGGQPYPVPDPTALVSLAEAVAETKCLSERFHDFCREVGQNPETVRCSVLAFNAGPDPFASLDAFDEYIGAYQEIGIDELIFYWPPIAYFAGRGPVPAAEQARFERIGLERVAAH